VVTDFRVRINGLYGTLQDYERGKKDYTAAICHFALTAKGRLFCSEGELDNNRYMARFYFEETTLAQARAKGVKECPKCLWFVTEAARSQPTWMNPTHGRRFVYAGPDALLDRRTGLVWVRNSGLGDVTYQEAENYCRTLSIDGVGDWRLPTRQELNSIAGSLGPGGSHLAMPAEPFSYSMGEYWAVDAQKKAGKACIRAVRSAGAEPARWRELTEQMMLTHLQHVPKQEEPKPRSENEPSSRIRGKRKTP